MLDSVYHMTLKLLKSGILDVNRSSFCHLLHNIILRRKSLVSIYVFS